ncbi:uncharacterized protein [Phaseolus vulgaris]|uniref:uncharacterized protein isoform X2 n=1 Tax=Phaseolus vulgaris TaxID=3885 RepID=UPI0035CB9F95
MSPNRRFEVPTMDIHPSHYEEIAINEQDVNNIILSYLAHNFYEESSEAFIACIGMQRPAEYLESMQTKKRIVNYVLEGNSLKAIELIEQLSQDILKNNKDLMLDLLSLHFVVLVCSQKWAEAVEFAQANMSSYASHSIYSERVEDFMSLLAFKNILESPMAHLTTTGYRHHVNTLTFPTAVLWSALCSS